MSTSNQTGEFEEDFTPKTSKRKISKKQLIMAAGAAVLVSLGFALYFLYQGYFYYQTDNAKVDAEIYQLPAEASGKILKLYAAQGDPVKAGMVLARVAHGPFVISPTDGTVVDVRAYEGDYVSAMDVVVVVARTTDIYITANVEESDILKIQKGQRASVYLDVYGRSFDGVIQDVDTVTAGKLSGTATSFTTSGTYTKVTQLIPVKIKLIDDVDLVNIIGTNATVKIRIK